MKKSILKKIYFKFLAAGLILFMLVQDIGYAAPAGTFSPDAVIPAAGAEERSSRAKVLSGIFSRLNLPEELGLVKASFLADSKQTVIHIQDLHINENAQLKIARIIDHVSSRYRTRLVQVEGASGELAHGLLSAYPDAKARKLAGRAFLKEGLITGPEFLAIAKNSNLILHGVEDSGLYEKNRQALLSALKLGEGLSGHLESLKRILEALAPVVLPEKVRSWLVKKRLFEANRHSISDYAHLIKGLCASAGVECATVQIDRLLKLESIEDEVRRAQRFKTEEELSGYLREAAKKTGGIDVGIFDEISAAEHKLEAVLMTAPGARELHKFFKIMDVYEKMFSLSLARENVEFLYQNRGEFTPDELSGAIKIMADHYGVEAVLEPIPFGKLEEALRAYEKFYEFALARDRALASGALQSMKKYKENISVLVTGGFHTPAVEAYLRKQRISFVTITPAIDGDINFSKDQKTYFQSMNLPQSPIAEFGGPRDAALQLQVPSRLPTRSDLALAGGELNLPRLAAQNPRLDYLSLMMIELGVTGLRLAKSGAALNLQGMLPRLSAEEKKLAEIYPKLQNKNTAVRALDEKTGGAVIQYDPQIGFGLDVKWRIVSGFSVSAKNPRRKSFSLVTQDGVSTDVQVLRDPILVGLARKNLERTRLKAAPAVVKRSEVRTALKAEPFLSKPETLPGVEPKREEEPSVEKAEPEEVSAASLFAGFINRLNVFDLLTTSILLFAAAYFFSMTLATLALGFLAYRLAFAATQLLNEWGHLVIAGFKYPSALTLNNFLGNRTMADWAQYLFLFQKPENSLFVEIPEIVNDHRRFSAYADIFSGIPETAEIAALRDRSRSQLRDVESLDETIRSWGWIAGTLFAGAAMFSFYLVSQLIAPEASVVLVPYLLGGAVALMMAFVSDFLSGNIPGIYHCGIFWITLKRLDHESDDVYTERMLKILGRLSSLMSLFGSHGVGAAMQVEYPNGKLDFIEFKMTPGHDQDAFFFQRIGRTGLIKKFISEFRAKIAAAKSAGARPRKGIVSLSGHVRLKTSGGKLTVDTTQPFYINPGVKIRRWKNVDGVMTPETVENIAYAAANGDTNKARVPWDKEGPYYEEGAWGRLFERMYGVKIGANDSEKAGYLMYFLTTQGSMADSLRFAYVASFTKHLSNRQDIFYNSAGKAYPVKAIDGDPPALSTLQSWESRLDTLIKEYGTQDWSHHPNILNQILDRAESLLPRDLVAPRASAEDYRKFLERALVAFQRNDGFYAARVMMAMVDASSTFGLFFESTLNPDKRILISREQPVAITENLTRGVQLGGSSYDFLRWTLRGADPSYKMGDSLRRLILKMTKKTPERGGEVAEIDHSTGAFHIYSMTEDRLLTPEEMTEGDPENHVPPRWKDITRSTAEWTPEKLDSSGIIDDLKQALPLSVAIHTEWRTLTPEESSTVRAAERFAGRWAETYRDFKETAKLLQEHGKSGAKQNIAPDLHLIVFREENISVANWFAKLMRTTFPLAHIKITNANDYIRDIDEFPMDEHTNVLFLDMGYNFPVIRTAEELKRRRDTDYAREFKEGVDDSEAAFAEYAKQIDPEGFASWNVLRMFQDRKAPHAFIMTPMEESNISRAMDPKQFDVISTKYQALVDGSAGSAWSQIVSLNELYLYLLKSMRSEFPAEAPFGMTATERDIILLDAAFENSIFYGLMNVIGFGFDEKGNAVDIKTPAHQNLLKLAESLTPYFTEQVRAMFLNILHLLLTIAFTGTIFEVLAFWTLIWFGPAFSLPTIVLRYILHVANFPLYLWWKYGSIRFLRWLEGRSPLRRDHNPAVLIGDDLWGRFLEVSFSKKVALAKSVIAPTAIHSSAQSTNLEGEQSHRANRGSMIFVSASAEMKDSNFVNSGHEAALLVTKQAQSIASIGAEAPMMIGIGDHPDLSKFNFDYSATTFDAQRAASQNLKKFDVPEFAGKIMELAYNSPLRLMAHEVVFRNIVRGIQSVDVWYPLAFQAEDTQNSLAATTAAPVRPPIPVWEAGVDWVISRIRSLGGIPPLKKGESANRILPDDADEKRSEVRTSRFTVLRFEELENRNLLSGVSAMNSLPPGQTDSAPPIDEFFQSYAVPFGYLGRQMEGAALGEPLSGSGLSMIESIEASKQMVVVDSSTGLISSIAVILTENQEAVVFAFEINYSRGEGGLEPVSFTLHEIRNGQVMGAFNGVFERAGEGGFYGLVRDDSTGQILFKIKFKDSEGFAKGSAGAISHIGVYRDGKLDKVIAADKNVMIASDDTGEENPRARQDEPTTSDQNGGGGGSGTADVESSASGSSGESSSVSSAGEDKDNKKNRTPRNGRISASDAQKLYPKGEAVAAAELPAALDEASEPTADLDAPPASENSDELTAESAGGKDSQPPAEITFVSAPQNAAGVLSGESSWILNFFSVLTWWTLGFSFVMIINKNIWVKRLFLAGSAAATGLLTFYLSVGRAQFGAGVFANALPLENIFTMLAQGGIAAAGSALLLLLSSNEAPSGKNLWSRISRIVFIGGLAAAGYGLFNFIAVSPVVRGFSFAYMALILGFLAVPILVWLVSLLSLPFHYYFGEQLRSTFGLNRRRHTNAIIAAAGFAALFAAGIQNDLIPRTVVPFQQGAVKQNFDERLERVTADLMKDPWKRTERIADPRPPKDVPNEIAGPLFVNSRQEETLPAVFEFQAVSPRYNDYTLPENSAVPIVSRKQGLHFTAPHETVIYDPQGKVVDTIHLFYPQYGIEGVLMIDYEKQKEGVLKPASFSFSKLKAEDAPKITGEFAQDSDGSPLGVLRDQSNGAAFMTFAFGNLRGAAPGSLGYVKKVGYLDKDKKPVHVNLDMKSISLQPSHQPANRLTSQEWFDSNSVFDVTGGEELLRVERPVVSTEAQGRSRLAEYLEDRRNILRERLPVQYYTKFEHLMDTAAAINQKIHSYPLAQDLDVYGNIIVPLNDGEPGIILPSRRLLGTPEPGAELAYAHSKKRLTLRVDLPPSAWGRNDLMKMKAFVSVKGVERQVRVIRAAVEPRLDGRIILTLALASEDGNIFEWDSGQQRPVPVDLRLEIPGRKKMPSYSNLLSQFPMHRSYGQFSERQSSNVETNETVGRVSFSIPESTWVKPGQRVGGVRDKDKSRLDDVAQDVAKFEKQVEEMIEVYKKLQAQRVLAKYDENMPTLAEFLIHTKTFVAQQRVRDYYAKESGILVGTFDSANQAASNTPIAKVLTKQIFITHRIENKIAVGPGDIVMIRSTTTGDETLGIVRQIEELPANKNLNEDDPRLYQEVRIEAYSSPDSWFGDYQYDMEVIYVPDSNAQTWLRAQYQKMHEQLNFIYTRPIETPIFPLRFVAPSDLSVKLKLIEMLQETGAARPQVKTFEGIPAAVEREQRDETDVKTVKARNPEVQRMLEMSDGEQRRIMMRFFLKKQGGNSGKELIDDLSDIILHGQPDLGQMGLDYMLKRGWIKDLIVVHRALYDKSPDLDMTKRARAHVIQLIETHHESAAKDPLQHLIQRFHSAGGLSGANASEAERDAKLIQEFVISLLASRDSIFNSDYEIAVREILESDFWPTYSDKLAAAKGLENGSADTDVPMSERRQAARRIRNFVFAEIARNIPMGLGEVQDYAKGTTPVKRYDSTTWGRIHGMLDDEHQDMQTLHSPWLGMLTKDAEPEENFKNLIGEERHQLALDAYTALMKEMELQEAPRFSFLSFHPKTGGFYTDHILKRLNVLARQEDFFLANPKNEDPLDVHALARIVEIGERAENADYRHWRGQIIDRLLEEDTPKARFLLARIFLKTNDLRFVELLLDRKADDLLIDEMIKLKKSDRAEPGIILLYQQALAKFAGLELDSPARHEGQQRLALRVILDSLSDYELRELSRGKHSLLNLLISHKIPEQSILMVAREQLSRRETLWAVDKAKDWASLPGAYDSKTYVKAGAALNDLETALRLASYHPERVKRAWQQGFHDDPFVMNVAADYYELRKSQIESQKRDVVGLFETWRYSIGWGLALFGSAAGLIWGALVLFKLKLGSHESEEEPSANDEYAPPAALNPDTQTIMNAAQRRAEELDGGQSARSEIRQAPKNLLRALDAKETFSNRMRLDAELNLSHFRKLAANAGVDFHERLADTDNALRLLASTEAGTLRRGEVVMSYEVDSHTQDFAHELSKFMDKNPEIRQLSLIQGLRTKSSDWKAFKDSLRSLSGFAKRRIVFGDEKGFTSLEDLAEARMEARKLQREDLIQVLEPASIRSQDKKDYEALLLGAALLGKETILVLGGDKPIQGTRRYFTVVEVLETLFRAEARIAQSA